ncbi:hypothetical protein P4126_33020 [Pseudomonas aeruginosa]|uniref:hypothetical protein n=1 Tax=Pseudomonas aeruginosa group TaxID=136841 RepID=UPI000CFDCC03|nr:MULTISPECIES: hypothetical protein [Pseudomonas aeruginosa group]EKU2932017.1 hypothetical protein [Pseudomonas aeruginosa]MCU8980334.1 hypothetical protein [Pseudomonas aeruginosa]MCU8986633.1 hypothetical protein [Pseudomonas aeruginosa]MCU8992880.1 hypothetical protein [Pseudomonas aeruginosa]MCU8999118.1 hypothetical protein [Pseudomonas aeruginosa]
MPHFQPFRAVFTAAILTLPLLAQAGGAAAVTVTAAAAAAASDSGLPNAGNSYGATGYLFVDGVGYSGGKMVYCPASVGFVKAASWFRSKNTIVKGDCQYKDGTLPAVSSQDFIDEVLGKGVATVVSVAPVFVQYGRPLGVIYYRDNGNGTVVDSRPRQTEIYE